MVLEGDNERPGVYHTPQNIGISIKLSHIRLCAVKQLGEIFLTKLELGQKQALF